MIDEQPLWTPAQDRIAASNLTSFMRYLSRHYGAYISDRSDLHALSIRAPEMFWPALWDFFGIIGDKGKPPFIANYDKIEDAQFFPGARLNYAENLLARPNQNAAVVFWSEDKIRRSVSWEELQGLVSRFQQYLTAQGIGAGDRVTAMLPNMPEALAAMLAVTSLGAIWSSCSPDFGVQGALDRFGQIEPKLFIACDGYYYNGKTIRTAEKARDIAAGLPGEPPVVIMSLLGEANEAAATVGNATCFLAAIAPYDIRPIHYERVPFDHPLFIMFSSGTTGVPKCIVHSTGGALIQHLKEHQLHCDLKPGDKLFYFTTLGWMMWNWLVTGLASGATLLLYDGSPFYPDGNILFDYADAEGMTVFGTSAKYIDAVKKGGLIPRNTHKLDSLRMMTSTGSPLVPEGFDFVYEGIKSDLHLASISGGTDICACFVGPDPHAPVWRGEIQAPMLAMAVEIFTPEGKPLDHGKGELVCTKPFPSMPVGFWNDPDGSKYHDAYFARYENIWHHGDFAEWTAHGGLIIHGRSDATLNPGGVRIGTAEIYRQVEKLEEVRESIVVGQDWDNDVRVVLFVVLREGQKLGEELINKIRQQIRAGATPRHVPAKIIQVPDIPRTKSGKITEIAVRDLVHGRDVANKEALANPEALDFYRELPELRA